MLSKLYKHEMKACARLLLPIYLVLAVLTVMDRIVISLDLFQKGALVVIPGFITFAYVLALIVVVIVSSVIIIIRFYRNFMTDEGYLMFTLPVKTSQLINSKLLASIIWSAGSVAAVIISLLGVFATPHRMDFLFDQLSKLSAEMKLELGSYYTLFIIEMVILILVSIFYSILQIYASIAIGQIFNGHKVIGSFAAYMGINTVLQVILTAIMFIVGLVFSKSFDEINSLPQIIFPLYTLFIIAIDVVFYWVTNFFFKRKLNLD